MTLTLGQPRLVCVSQSPTGTLQHNSKVKKLKFLAEKNVDNKVIKKENIFVQLYSVYFKLPAVTK